MTSASAADFVLLFMNDEAMATTKRLPLTLGPVPAFPQAVAP